MATAEYPKLFSESTEQPGQPSNQFPPRCPKCQRQYPRSKWSKFDPVCAGCGHELKLICDYCHEEYTPKRWQWHQKGGRFCCQSHRARWHNVNGDDSWTKERKCPCGCGRIFTPKKRRHIFYSDDCQYRNYRKLHAKELDAAATVYYQAHKEEIAARTQKHRQDPEVRERIHAQGRAWRAGNPDKVKENNARSNAAQRAKLAKAWRPDDWEDWAADEQYVAIMLIENPDIKNRQIGIRLDGSRFRCSFGNSWERALTQPGSGATWIHRVRDRLKAAQGRA